MLNRVALVQLVRLRDVFHDWKKNASSPPPEPAAGFACFVFASFLAFVSCAIQLCFGYRQWKATPPPVKTRSELLSPTDNVCVLMHGLCAIPLLTCSNSLLCPSFVERCTHLCVCPRFRAHFSRTKPFNSDNKRVVSQFWDTYRQIVTYLQPFHNHFVTLFWSCFIRADLWFCS